MSAMDFDIAQYGASLAIALGILILAVALVVMVNRMSQTWKLVGLIGIFGGGVIVNYLLARGDDPGFRATLSQVLEWTYASLTMFAGQGSVEVVEELATPDQLPVVGLELVRYFFQVLAFLVAIAAIVNALANQFATRVGLLTSLPRRLMVVHGDSPEALLLAKGLAESAERRDDIVLVTPGQAPENLPRRVQLLPDGPRTRRALKRAARWARKERHFFLFDDETPEYVTTCTAWLTELEKIGKPITAHVLLASDWSREEIAPFRTTVDLKTFDVHEMTARHLIQVAPPVATMSPFVDGRATQAFSAVVIGSPHHGLERLLQQLVMNAQFLPVAGLSDARPRFLVQSDAEMEGSFRSRFPEVHLSAEIEFLGADPGSQAFWQAVHEHEPHLVVVALPDSTDGIQLARRIRHDHLVRGVPFDTFPAIVVQGESPSPSAPQESEGTGATEKAGLRWFGGRQALYDPRTILDEAGDRKARQVNRRYAELYTTAEDVPNLPDADALWADLSYLDRVSSRASADFNSAMLVINETAGHLPKKERLNILGMTEHLRWNAFYRMRGYSRMTHEDWLDRFQVLTGPDHSLDPSKAAKAARTDSVRKQHICLVEWDELPDVDDLINSTLEDTGLTEFQRVDFKETDRRVVVLEEEIS